MKHFITRVNHPSVFIGTDRLVVSKKLMNKKIRQYNQEIRESSDTDFIKGRRLKIQLLKLIVDDLKELIEILA
jgi:hypothetical protein